RLEEVPAEVKQITYSVNCTVGTITNVNPNMVISTDKHSASKTIKQLYSAVSAIAQFPQTGNLSLGLTVTVIFNDDSYLQKSYSIFINVVSATLTVYADPPKNPVRMVHIDPNAICVTGNDIGHSFWKVEVEKKSQWGTDKKITLIDDNGTPQAPQDVASCPYGFYPFGWNKMVLALIVYNGVIGDDSPHSVGASKSYSITITKAKAVIDETIDLATGHNYHLQNVGGKNCTKQCVHISNDIAGCNAPSGIGMVGWRPTANTVVAAPSFIWFANPYHHTKQLSQ
ncbi:MAG: hypothetical protein LBG58_13040, partial [Planctomycetaceae bacterium]|nr:hypothetical protein [Planctomycetaceae bacterium]